MKRMRSSECGLRNEIQNTKQYSKNTVKIFKSKYQKVKKYFGNLNFVIWILDLFTFRNPQSTRLSSSQAAIQNPKAQGFTLIEMLLAISIFSMMVVVIFSSFLLGIGSWEKGEEDIEFFQKLRSVSELLYREINSTFPYKITPGVLTRYKKFYAFFGKSDSLKFVSYANLHRRTGGLSLLELWVEDGKGLMMGEDAALVSNLSDLEDIDLREENRSVVLFPEVKKVEFRYFDRKRRDEEGEWLERWDPKDKRTRLPLFVEITLSISDKNDEELTERLIVPVMSMRM